VTYGLCDKQTRSNDMTQETQDKTYPFGDLSDTARGAALAWWESEGLDDWAVDITDYAK